MRQGRNLLALVLLQLFLAMKNWDNRMDHLASLEVIDPALATKIFSAREIRVQEVVS